MGIVDVVVQTPNGISQVSQFSKYRYFLESRIVIAVRAKYFNF